MSDDLREPGSGHLTGLGVQPELQSGLQPELAEAAALLERFFEAWGRLDAAAVVACLHPEISFSDPMFPSLRREQVPAMWRMLIASMALHPSDFSLQHKVVFLEDRKAQVHWQVHFRNVAGRKIHHKALATFTFWDGRIVRHVDGYHFYSWARQSLGLSGLLLGWHKGYREAVQAAARKQLAVYMSLHPDTHSLPHSSSPGQTRAGLTEPT